MNTGIDWADVKKRLNDSQIALEKALTPDPERIAAIYRERADQLARRRVRAEGGSSAWRVLVFLLGKERYGMDFSAVAELFPFSNCSPVPGGPPQLLGVTNVHGEIRSVVDMGRLLELPGEERLTPGYVLLVRHQGREVGLRVDGIDKIQPVEPNALITPAEGAAEPAFRYLRGLTPDKLRLLSLDAIFDHDLFK